jgi:uncharacterized protein (DUF433 family)
MSRVKSNQPLGRINSNPSILRGRPKVKGTRIAVHMVLEALATGLEPEELLLQWPDLTLEDIKACLLFGARMSNYEWISLEGEKR